MVRFLYATNRVVETGREHWDALEEEGQSFLLPVWHETAAIVLPHLGKAGLHVLVSKSFDGELGTELIKRFGLEAFRGSSSRGGKEAMTAMVKDAANIKALAMAIDGPRGPRRVAKSGMAVLSQRTGFPLLPVASGATKAWRLGSWDKTNIPKPFGTYVFAIGEAIAPAESADRECIEAKTLEIQTKLNALQEGIEAEHGIDIQWVPTA